MNTPHQLHKPPPFKPAHRLPRFTELWFRNIIGLSGWSCLSVAWIFRMIQIHRLTARSQQLLSSGDAGGVLCRHCPAKRPQPSYHLHQPGSSQAHQCRAPWTSRAPVDGEDPVESHEPLNELHTRCPPDTSSTLGGILSLRQPAQYSTCSGRVEGLHPSHKGAATNQVMCLLPVLPHSLSYLLYEFSPMEEASSRACSPSVTLLHSFLLFCSRL